MSQLRDNQIADHFLRLLRQTGNVRWSAMHAGYTSTRPLYKRRERDPEFAEAWDEAQALAVAELEEYARKRAMGETRKPLAHQGLLTGHSIPDQSDAVLMKMLAAKLPDEYGNKVQVDANTVTEFIVRDVVAEADLEADLLS